MDDAVKMGCSVQPERLRNAQPMTGEAVTETWQRWNEELVGEFSSCMLWLGKGLVALCMVSITVLIWSLRLSLKVAKLPMSLGPGLFEDFISTA